MGYEVRKIDTERAVKYLNHAFKHACEEKVQVLGKNSTRGTDLYKYQVDYSYVINEIVVGPNYFASKYISEANAIIAELKELKPKKD